VAARGSALSVAARSNPGRVAKYDDMSGNGGAQVGSLSRDVSGLRGAPAAPRGGAFAYAEKALFCGESDDLGAGK
jgi:hypothetical protein